MSCGKCKHASEPWKEESGNYVFCRRFPPQVFPTGPEQYRSQFPAISVQGICGEYAKAKAKSISPEERK